MCFHSVLELLVKQKKTFLFKPIYHMLFLCTWFIIKKLQTTRVLLIRHLFLLNMVQSWENEMWQFTFPWSCFVFKQSEHIRHTFDENIIHKSRNTCAYILLWKNIKPCQIVSFAFKRRCLFFEFGEYAHKCFVFYSN